MTPCKTILAFPALLALGILVSGCDGFDLSTRSNKSRIDGTSTSIKTSQSVYALRLTPDFLELDVEFTFTNPTSRSVFIFGCNGRSQPMMEKREGDQWIAAWIPSQELCLTLPADSVGAGETITDTLIVRAGRHQDYSPRFLVGSVPGEYRLVWDVYSGSATNFNGADKLPLEHRISTPFVVVE